ncbi:MAG: L,D-transpeptidase [Candidatus Blackburnbacteria bacterium]|nr:L,D-transpeptidase [Candidatus Blackburnbacteria bacterium]
MEKTLKIGYYDIAVFTRLPWFLPPILVFAALFVLFNTTTNKSGSIISGCGFSNVSGDFVSSQTAYFEGNKVSAPKQDNNIKLAKVLGAETGGEKWIEVNLTEQKLIAHEGDKVFLETKISSGFPWTPTPEGEFTIWGKFRYTKMEGGSGKYYYYLPNVPYVMFFENSDVVAKSGYGLHGTYWHSDFGKPRSHGCVNLPTSIAQQLFYWTGPVLPSDKGTVRAGPNNPGTRIVIHK